MERLERLPLEGVRVTDFSWAAAGPYGTLLLASLGAEVVKITSARATGGLPNQRAAQVDAALNYNKKSVTLNLTTPEGVALAEELVKISDLVVENYRQGTMKKFGLDYDELVKVKPDIVMVSASAFGAEGPKSQYVGFAPIFSATSGNAHITGYPDGIPTDLRLVMDYTVGETIAYAAMLGLYHHRMTGQGQHVDLAAREAISCLMGEAFLDVELNGGRSADLRMGNRDHIMAPHGVYRCKGEDAWISIAVATQGEWGALCRAAGRRDWLTDERFSDGYARWLNQEELDRQMNAWTSDYTPFDLMSLLQDKGVAAVPSYRISELFQDPHLQERGFSEEVTMPSGEGYTVIASPWIFDGHRLGARHPAPSPGEDNIEVLGDLLGVPIPEIQRLVEAGAVR